MADDGAEDALDGPEPGEDVETPATSPRGIAVDAERGAALTPREAIREMRIRLPVRGNKTLRAVVDRANRDEALKAWWHVSNVNAVRRMHINDHSWVHVQVVANIALKLLRDLVRKGAVPNAVQDYGMRVEDAEVIVILGVLWHCTGMAVHRKGHEDWSLIIAGDGLPRMLEGLYEEPERTVVMAEVLHTINGHRSDGEPLTLEAGIVRVADALDMAKGRSRIPFAEGSLSIHALSAQAIERVSIRDGEARPVLIEVEMTNSAGVFQIDELLRRKIRGSGLEHWLEVVGRIEGENERLLVPLVRL